MKPKTALLLFLYISGCCAAWPLYVSIGIGHIDTSLYAAWVQILSFVLVIVAVKGYSQMELYPQVAVSQGPIKVYFGVVITLFLYGLVIGNQKYYAASETLVFLVFGAFILLGRYDQVWEDLYKPMLVLYWIGVALVAFGLYRRGTRDWTAESVVYGLTGGEAGGDRFVKSLGYDLRYLLQFWLPIFCMAAFGKTKGFWKIAGLATMVPAFVFGALLFQFRSELVVTVVVILLVMMGVPILRRKLQFANWAIALVILVGSFAVIWSQGSMEKILDRVESSGLSDSRTLETEGMLKDLAPPEYIIGKGLGGWYKPPAGWTGGIEQIRGENQWGRYQIHIGIMLPVLKGGLMLSLTFLFLVLRAFKIRLTAWYDNPYNASSVVIVFVFFLLLLMVPFPTVDGLFWAAAGGLACGRAGTLIEADEDPAVEFYAETYDQVTA